MKPKYRSVLYKYFINYAVIAALIIFCAFLFFFTYALNLYLDREVQENSLKLDRSSQALDLQLKACIDIKYKIERDYLFSYQTLAGPLTSVESVKMLSNMINHTDIFDTIMVIYDAPGIYYAYSSSGTIDLQYFDQYYAMDPIKLADIKMLISDVEQPIFLSLGKRPEPGYSSERILLVFPSGSQYRPLGVLFHINASEFAAILAQPFVQSDYQVFIVDQQDRVLFTRANYEGMAYDELAVWLSGNMDDVIKINRSTSVYQQRSEHLGVRYLVVVQHRSLLQRTVQIGSVLLTVMLVILVLALAISYGMAHKAYRPIKRILYNLGQIVPGCQIEDPVHYGNEFDYIEQVIRHTGTVNPALAGTDNNEYIINAKLSMLFSGGFDAFCAREIYQELGLEPEQTYFILLLLSVDNKQRYLSGFTTAERNEIAAAFRNSFKHELTDMTALFFLSPMVNMTTCFVAMGQAGAEEGQARVLAAIDCLRAKAGTSFGLTLTITISRVYDNIKESQQLFYYIVNAAKYKYVTGENAVINTDSEPFSGPFIDLKVNSLIFDLYQQLIDDEIGQAGLTLDHIINLLSQAYSPSLLSNVYTNVLSVFARVNKTLIHDDSFDVMLGQAIRSEPETEQELREILNRCIGCITKARNKMNSHEAVRTRILDLIEKDYVNPALSLDSVADQVNLSPSSLSKFIKREFGSNFLIIVNNLRLQKAKALLLKTDLPIHEIAAASGYNDISNFNRRFKADLNITPSEFRKQENPKD